MLSFLLFCSCIAETLYYRPEYNILSIAPGENDGDVFVLAEVICDKEIMIERVMLCSNNNEQDTICSNLVDSDLFMENINLAPKAEPIYCHKTIYSYHNNSENNDSEKEEDPYFQQ
jgi:hypothetical protein